MNKLVHYKIGLFLLIIGTGCSNPGEQSYIQDVKERHIPQPDQVWLTHEHILVDFVGADSIQPESWNHDSIIRMVMPYMEELRKFNVHYFVDATPAFLGRDVLLLKKIADKTGIRIVTNTGLYGALNNKYIPAYAWEMPAEDLANTWIGEFQHGIEGTSVRPGFIKIAIDQGDSLSPLHQKLVKAAALTHLATGLTIASHTGKAAGLWPQLEILAEAGVAAESFIWVHAQAEEDHDLYLKAAEKGCWISFDGMAWELENHTEKLLFAKRNGILDRILISHDAGWYDPQKDMQTIRPYSTIFNTLYPQLLSQGFTDEEFMLLTSANPQKAFSIGVRKIDVAGKDTY